MSIPPEFRAKFRSGFEAEVCFPLQQAGIQVADYYERERLPYVEPAHTRHYKPDLLSNDGKLALELKGRFADVDERMKYIWFAESNPDIEVRFILQRARQKLYKGSKTLVEDWLRGKGFKVAIGAIPPEWVEELTR